ncbi:MAG: T9SS type A sorting domain-containing protein [Flavobacteriales bacterium]|nr:T9SS type A sorting domain-containing protein [Flavobacteriales bacterium]
MLNDPRFGIARYLENGTLDDTFGNQGVAITFIEDGTFGAAIALQNDGKLVLIGNSVNFTTNKTSIATARYSTGIVVSNDQQLNLSNDVLIYPNPEKDRVQIDFSLNEAAKIDFTLTDANGKVIANLGKGVSFGSGNNTYSLLMPNELSVGVYYLNLHLPNFNKVIKILHEE